MFSPISPLRYPGAKKWMSGYIDRAISFNDLSVELFVEPFAGSSSVAVSLLCNDIVGKVGLNERDPLVASFWHTLFFDTDWLITQIEKIEVDLDQWEKMKNLNPINARQNALKCIFLNRTNFSGILKNNAGPIGGKSQLSKYKIDCRFNKNTIIERISKISSFRKRISFIWNLDWEDAIDSIRLYQSKKKLSKSTLFYLDPPFYKKGKSLYQYSFKKNDHLRLMKYLNNLPDPWILSYDMCPEILKIYKNCNFPFCDVNLIYTTRNYGKREIGKEIILSNLSKMVSELQLGANKRVGKLNISKKFKNSSDHKLSLKNSKLAAI